MDVWVVSQEPYHDNGTLIGVATRIEEAYQLAVDWAKANNERAPLPLNAFRGRQREDYRFNFAMFNEAIRLGHDVFDDDYESKVGYFLVRLPLTKPAQMEGSIPIADLKPGTKAYTGTMYSRAIIVESVDSEKGTAMIRDASSPNEKTYEFDGGNLFPYPPMGAFIMSTHKQPPDQSVSDQPNATQDG